MQYFSINLIQKNNISFYSRNGQVRNRRQNQNHYDHYDDRGRGPPPPDDRDPRRDDRRNWENGWDEDQVKKKKKKIIYYDHYDSFKHRSCFYESLFPSVRKQVCM